MTEYLDVPIPHYREDKATQVAALLLSMAGHSLSRYVLLKYMYLVDREALITLGRPVSFDRMVSMEKGPLLSTTYDLIKGASPIGETGYWRGHIAESGNYQVHVTASPGTSSLSQAEIKVIRNVFARMSKLTLRQLMAHVHDLPEHEDPGRSSRWISVRKVLAGEQWSEDDIRAVESALASEAAMERVPG